MTKETAIACCNLLMKIRECDQALRMLENLDIVMMPLSVPDREVGPTNLYKSFPVPDAAKGDLIRYYRKVKEAAEADLEKL